jgi:hypothetical protein
MKKALKRTLIALPLIGVLIVICTLVYSYRAMKSPQQMTALAQDQIQKSLGMPVSVTKAVLDWKKGPRVTLSTVSIDSPGNLSLKIKKAYAHLSVWHLIYGDILVTRVRLIEPIATINLENWERFKSQTGAAKRPKLLVWNGSLNLLHQGRIFSLKEVNGRIDPDLIELRARTLGGRVNLEADLTKPGKTAIEAYDIHLEEFGKGYSGLFRMSLALENEPKGMTGSFLLDAKDFSVPWVKKRVEKFTASINASGTKDLLNLTEISLKTPLVAVSGKGAITGNMFSQAWPDAKLSLDVSSTEFDYEQVLSYLPVNSFPDWLKTLLTRQIRQGRSSFPVARYHGPVKGFLVGGETLMDNLHIIEAINGQSFSTGYGNDRATNIMGQVIYGRDITVRIVSGMVGRSKLSPITIVFPAVMKPYMRVTVDASADMPAEDFIRTWRATMVPEEVHKLLSPITKVKSGHIQGHVITRYNEQDKKPLQFKGYIKLANCAYTWGTHIVQGQTGIIRSEEYSLPLKLTMAAEVDKYRISKLDMTLDEPFVKNRYRFVLSMTHLPAFKNLEFGDAALTLTGRGEGHRIKGAFDFHTPWLTLFQTQYKPASKVFSIHGDVKAFLSPKIGIDLSDITVHLPSAKLTGAAEVREDKGALSLNGNIDLDEIVVQGGKGSRKLGGKVSGTAHVSWDKTLVMDWQILMEDAALMYKEKLYILNGPLAMKSSKMISPGLKISNGDTSAVLSGDLNLGKQVTFQGNIDISRMKVGGEGAFKPLELPGNFQADAKLTCSDCDIYSFPISNASAIARIDQGVLNLSHIELESVSGGVKGDASIVLGGKTSFDFVVSIKDGDLGKLFRSKSSGRPLITGRMDLEGHIYGNDDAVNGSLVFHAKDGEIGRYRIVSQIFSLLNIYKIIQNRDTDFLSSHFTYSNISSTFTIRDGIMSFHDFSLESNSIQLSAVGEYSLKTKNIDSVIGVEPLESVDKTLSIIPILGWVLTGDKGRFIVVTMKAQGPIDDPKVQIAPIKTVSNAVIRPLLRTLKLPEHIYSEFMKMID